MTEAIHDLDPHNPHIRPNTKEWRGEEVPNPLELLARASINTALQPFRLAEVLARTVPAMGRISQGVAQRRFATNKPVPRTRFNGTVSAHRVVEGRSFDLKEVRAIKSSVPGATINDVVLTLCGGALRRYLPDPEFFADCIQQSYDDLKAATLGKMSSPVAAHAWPEI